MKKFSALSLVISAAMVFSIAGFGCKKSEQPAETPKSAEQTQSTQTSMAVEEFKVSNGTLEKGGIGFILSSEKDKAAVAMKKLDTPYKNIMKIKGQIKSALPSGTRNGFVTFTGYFSDKKAQGAMAGILIGGKKFTIDGAFVEKVELPKDFEQGKIFDFDLTINLKEKTVSMEIGGENMTSKMTKAPLFISNIGFLASHTSTEFSDLQISGN